MSLNSIASAYSSSTWGVPNATVPVAPVGSASDDDASSTGSQSTSSDGDSSMLDVLTQALQALGVDTSSSDTTASDSTSANGSASSSGNNQGLDVGLFMNSLFSAMNDTDTLVNSTSQDPGTDVSDVSQGTGNTFTGDLSSLLTQIGNGNTPPGLQSSFDAMMSGIGGSSGSGASSSSTTPSMPAVLNQLQQQAQSSTTYGASAPSSLFLSAYA